MTAPPLTALAKRFDDVDLSQLPAPDAIEALDYEQYLIEWKARFAELAQLAGFDYDVGLLETDPIVIAMQVGAEREALLRGRFNDKVRAELLAHSKKNDLDGLAALYKIKRQVVVPAEGSTPAVYEDDERLREIVHGAPEALSTCGPEGGYIHFAKRADTSIKDVAAFKVDEKGNVYIVPLVSAGNGLPSNDILDKVRLALRLDNRRPFTDNPQVRAPVIRPYTFTAHLQIPRGPDASLIRTRARSALQQYVTDRHRVGVTVFLAGLTAAAKTGGVENVVFPDLSTDLVAARDEAFYCTSFAVTSQVIA